MATPLHILTISQGVGGGLQSSGLQSQASAVWFLYNRVLSSGFAGDGMGARNKRTKTIAAGNRVPLWVMELRRSGDGSIAG